jgi:hypothetical protein
MRRGQLFGVGVIFLAVSIVLLGSGCTQTGLTKPTRSAVEQLLISTAADQALAKADWGFVRGKNIFVDRSFYDSLDKDYVIGTIRDHVSLHGGLLVTNMDQAEYVLEPRSGALSIDSSSSVIGLPASSAPMPFAGAVSLPEVALFKSEKQYSIAKLAILVYERASKKHIASSGPLVGRANIKYYKFLGYIGYTKTTIPEKKKQKKQR